MFQHPPGIAARIVCVEAIITEVADSVRIIIKLIRVRREWTIIFIINNSISICIKINRSTVELEIYTGDNLPFSHRHSLCLGYVGSACRVGPPFSDMVAVGGGQQIIRTSIQPLDNVCAVKVEVSFVERGAHSTVFGIYINSSATSDWITGIVVHRAGDLRCK